MRWNPPSVFKSGLFFFFLFHSGFYCYLTLENHYKADCMVSMTYRKSLYRCEATSSCWFYCRVAKFWCSFKQISNTWAKGRWPRWHSCNPSSCTAVALGVSESPALSAVVGTRRKQKGPELLGAALLCPLSCASPARAGKWSWGWKLWGRGSCRESRLCDQGGKMKVWGDVRCTCIDDGSN